MLLFFHYGSLCLSYMPRTSHLTSWFPPLERGIKDGTPSHDSARINGVNAGIAYGTMPAYRECSISVSYALPSCIRFAYHF